MTTSAVSLAELKAHLRVDHDFEDDLIESFGIAATELAEQVLNRPIVSTDANAVCSSTDEVPKSLKVWVCLYVTDLYEKRGISDSAENKPRLYDHLLDRFILYRSAHA